jgi:hypothetical protein
VTTPTQFELKKNGRLHITWASGTLVAADVDRINDRLPMQFGFISAVRGPWEPDSDHSLIKILGTRGAVEQASSPPISSHEISNVWAPDENNGCKWTTPVVTAPSGRSGICTFSGTGPSSTTTGDGTAVTFVDNYTGETTDIQLEDVPSGADAQPAIYYDIDQIRFKFSGERACRLAPGANWSDIEITINGQSTNATASSEIINGNQVFLAPDFTQVTPNSFTPGDTVLVDYPAGTFEIAEAVQETPSDWSTHPRYDCDDATFITVLEGNATIAKPELLAFEFINPTTIRLFWDVDVVVVNGGSGWNITWNRDENVEDEFGTPLFNYDSQPSAKVTNFRLSSGAVYEGEEVTIGFILADRVRNAAAPNDSAAGNELVVPNALESITVGSQEGAASPAPVLLGATVLADGERLSLSFDIAVSYVGGNIAITNEYFTEANQNLTFSGTFVDPGTDKQPIFDINPMNPVRNYDTVTADIPAGLFENKFPVTEDHVVYNGRAVTNNSDIPFPNPEVLDSNIPASGDRIEIIFDRAVSVPTDVEGLNIEQALIDNITVIATDISAGTPDRTFTVDDTLDIDSDTDTITNDTLVVRLTGGGLIFGVDTPSAGDGDDVVFHSNGVSGWAVSAASAGPDLADALAFVDAIEAESPEVVDNESTVDEPAADVTPTIVEAEVYDVGADQFLRIRWDDGSATPITVQRSSAKPTISGSVTGGISLEDGVIQDGAGSGDEIAYQVIGDKLKRESDGEIVTLSIPASVVTSSTTGTPNAESGPYVSNVDSELTNNSTIGVPQPSELPPTIQQIYIHTDGRTVGVYYDVDISAGPATSGSGYATQREDIVLTRKQVTPTQQTLLLMQSDKTIFRGETVLIDLVAGLVVNPVNNLTNTVATAVEAENNSLVPVPAPPIIDSAVLNDPGTVLTINFDKAVVAGSGSAYADAKVSGRHTVRITSINDNSVTAEVVGKVFEEDTEVTLVLEQDFVLDSLFEATGNISQTFDVNVSARTSAAPDLPDNAQGLNP